jgi:adenylate cyclase
MPSIKIPKAEILDQLSKILRSQIFRSSDMLKNFLAFVVKETVNEGGENLKQYTIALNAFGRSEDFDSTEDPIVRIQASRLRRHLEEYYKDEGALDSITISLPKGGYTPTFERTVQRQKPLAHSIGVSPIKNLNPDASADHIVEGFRQELIIELSRYKHLEVVKLGFMENEITRNSIARFNLEGSFRNYGSALKISVILLDNLNDQIIWSYQEKYESESKNLIQIQEDLAIAVASKICGMNGIIPEKLYSESRWEAKDSPSAYETYLHFYKYTKNPSPENAEDLLEKVTNVVTKEPEFALGWAVLTCLYTDIFQFSQDRKFLEEALEFGKKSVSLQPTYQPCQAYYSYALFSDDQLEKAKDHCKLALEINPNSSHYVGGVGFLYCFMDMTKEGYQLIMRSIETDFDYPKWWQIGIFVHHLKQKDYHQCLVSANRFDKEDIFWSFLLKMTAHYLLDNPTEAQENSNKLRKIKPDFFDMPREYVKSLIKDQDSREAFFKAIDSIPE